MNNSTKCENCGSENSFYKHICSNCGAFLRTKVENIDFWSSAWNIFSSPLGVFEKIVHAEHKNYVFVLSVIIAIKYFIITSFIRNIIEINILNTSAYVVNILNSILSVIIFTTVLSFILKFLMRLLKVETRFKDNFSVIIYSFVPVIFALLFLFPVQYAMFGPKFFSFNPSPFMLNYSTALILSLVDGLMTLWTLFLLTAGFKVQSNSIVFGIISGLLVFGGFAAAALYSPLFL